MSCPFASQVLAGGWGGGRGRVRVWGRWGGGGEGMGSGRVVIALWRVRDHTTEMREATDGADDRCVVCGGDWGGGGG